MNILFVTKNYRPGAGDRTYMFNLEKLLKEKGHEVAYFAMDHPLNMSTPFSKYFVPPVIHYLRLWDESSSHRVDHFIANSHTVALRIKKYYRRSADVIHPPVDTVFFQPGESKKDYFLVVSALVPYKRIDMAVAAFNKSERPLFIIGDGPDYRNLKRQGQKEPLSSSMPKMPQ